MEVLPASLEWVVSEVPFRANVGRSQGHGFETKYTWKCTSPNAAGLRSM